MQISDLFISIDDKAREAVLMSTSIKAQKNSRGHKKTIKATKTAEINKKPSLFFPSLLCCTLHKSKLKLSIFLGQQGLWASGREWIRKVPALKRFCLFPKALLVWDVSEAVGQRLLHTKLWAPGEEKNKHPHSPTFSASIATCKAAAGLSAGHFNEVVKCAGIF